MNDPAARRRSIPSVDRVLRTPAAEVALGRFDRGFVRENVRAVLDELRTRLAADASLAPPSADDVMAAAVARIEQALLPPLRRVVNATGVVLHTNLGRALLAPEAVAALSTAAANNVNLEIDLGSGKRGRRDDLVAEDLCALTTAEAATVVNNNAAAVLLALNTLAEGREVVISRGELIEIGGSFRMPDVLAKSGARLREVGTTNRTHLRDYTGAIGENTALLLKVHTSNYRIVGFAGDVSLGDLVALGRRHGLPVMEDLGSGALVDLSAHGLPREPLVCERIRLGADLVSFSGDKLLGGPQAGILAGRRDLIERIDQNPLKRALRCDKLTLAALGATLRLYRTSHDLRQALPTLRLLTRSVADLAAVGAAALPLLQSALGDDFELELIDSSAEVGSGALPTASLPSKGIAVRSRTVGEEEVAALFRSAEPPILGRIRDGRFLLDLRSIEDPADLVPRRLART